MAADHPGGLTRDHVVWAYRLLLDRDPENEDVIGPKLAGSHDTKELRGHLMTSAEFQDKNRDYAHTNDRTVVIKELDGGVRLFVDLADHVIGLNIVRGHYETDEVRYMRRVLKPSGRLFFAEHGLADDPGVARWQNRLNPAWLLVSRGCNMNRPIAALLRDGGFAIDVETLYLPGPRILNYHYWGTALPA